MPRWPADEVDAACECWAFQWVQHFAREPDRAGRTLGPLRCTLGRVRELHDGAGSTTDASSQRWPEVFLGTGLLVAVAMQHMSEASRRVLHAHYVGRWWDAATWRRRPRPIKQSVIAEQMGVSIAEYYHRRDTAKACVATVLSLGAATEAPATRSARPVPSAGVEVQRAAGAIG